MVERIPTVQLINRLDVPDRTAGGDVILGDLRQLGRGGVASGLLFVESGEVVITQGDLHAPPSAAQILRRAGLGARPCRRPHRLDSGGGGDAAPENGKRSVQARRDKPSTATENRTPLRGDRRSREKPNLQASKLPNFL